MKEGQREPREYRQKERTPLWSIPTKDMQEFGRRFSLDNREGLMTARARGLIPTRREEREEHAK